MPQPSTFRYSIQNANRDLWYYVASGDVFVSSIPKYLTDDTGNQAVSPIEWQDTEIGYTRNEKFWGVFRKFSVPLSFTFQAIDILKHILVTGGHEADAVLVIEQVNDSWEYDEVYSGDFDFSNIEYADGLDDFFFKANIAERGISELLKANEDITYEIPLDGDAITINHDGHKLRQFTTLQPSDSIITPSSTNALHVPSIARIESQALAADDTTTGIEYFSAASAAAVFGTRAWIYKASTGGDITVSYNFSITASDVPSVTPVGVNIRVELFVVPHASTTPSQTILLYQGTNDLDIFNDVEQFINGFQNITVNALDELYIITRSFDPDLNVGGFNLIWTTYNATVSAPYIKIAYNSLLSATDVDAFTYPVFLEKLFKKALGSSVTLSSTFLNAAADYETNYDNCPKFTCVTSSEALRGLPDAVIKTSISEVYQDMRRWGLGIGIYGNNVIVEPLEYFLDKDTEIFTLDTVVNFKWTVAREYIGNKVLTGNATQQFDELNALFSFHTQTEWKYPTTRVINDLTWDSPYIADLQAIEYTRLLGIQEKDSYDSKTDNKVFLIETETSPTSGKYNILRLSGTINGIANPDTAYNFGLTPKRTLYWNGGYLKSIGYGKIIDNSEEITFQTTQKNPDLETTLDYGLIVERDDIAVDAFDKDALFQPFIFEFDTVSPDNLVSLMESNPYGAVRFMYNNSYFKMFVLDIAIKPATKDTYSVRGLSCPDNDLTLL